MRFLILLVSILISVAGNASEPATSWLISEYGRINCNNISMGTFKLRAALENGEKLIYPVKLIKSYSIYGKVFSKLPVYKNGKPCGKMAFMEQVEIFGDLALYRYTPYKHKSVRHCEIIYRYLLYQGNQLRLASDGIRFPDISFRSDHLRAVK